VVDGGKPEVGFRDEGKHTGDDVVGLLVRERRSLDILPVKRGKAVCK